MNHAPFSKPQPSSATKSFLERLLFGLLEIGHSRAELSDRRLWHIAQNVYGQISIMVSQATSKIIDIGLLARRPSDWLNKVRHGIRSPNDEEQWDAGELDLGALPSLNLISQSFFAI